MNHRRTLGCGLLLAAAALVALPAPALVAGASHVEFSIVGDVARCPDATHTVQSGSIKEVFQEVESAPGNQMFTVTDIPQHVVLVDEIAATYTMRGATWFGGATNDNTGAEVITATHNLVACL